MTVEEDTFTGDDDDDTDNVNEIGDNDDDDMKGLVTTMMIYI